MAERYSISRYGPTFKLEYGLAGVLEPGQQIFDPSLTIGVASNGQLRAAKFMPRFADLGPIQVVSSEGNQVYSVPYSGKSGVIVFENKIDRSIVGALIRDALNRGVDRRDKLHISTVGKIGSVGWQVFWTPLPGDNMLHVRMVPRSSLMGTEFYLEEAEALQSVFSKAA